MKSSLSIATSNRAGWSNTASISTSTNSRKACAFSFVRFSPTRVHYLGHIKIGQEADLTLDELREILNPSAVVVACGAQGTKALGIPGDATQGVYHAKDLVYHFNGLPEFSRRDFRMGDRVAIIGVGNVMVDVAHWLVHEKKVKEVIAVARRGPAQRAYTDVEIQAVAANFD